MILRRNVVMQKINETKNITKKIKNQLKKKIEIDITKNWSRTCPICEKILIHKNEKSYKVGVSKKLLCRSCVQKNKPAWNKGLTKDTDERVKKYSNSLITAWVTGKETGRTSWNTGLSVEDDRVKLNVEKSRLSLLTGYETGKVVPWNKGKSFPQVAGDNSPTKRPEVRQKLRLSIIESIKKCKNGIAPRYNPHACRLFDAINKEMGWCGLHAENGGEFYIKDLGYWVDYYEPTLNIVIEYYEKGHNKTKTIIRDTRRQQEIINLLKCKFIVIHEKEESSWKKIIKEQYS